MRLVEQTRFGSPDGNCWEACLASILEVEIDEIPDARQDGGERWGIARFNAWLIENHGKALVRIHHRQLGCNSIQGFHIYVYETLGKKRHAVVARGRKIVHDPAGGAGGIPATPLYYDCIVPLETGGTPA